MLRTVGGARPTRHGQPVRTNTTQRGFLLILAGSKSPPLALGQRSLSAPTNCICGWHQTLKQAKRGGEERKANGVCRPRPAMLARCGAASKPAPAHRHRRLRDTALCAVALGGPLPDTRTASGKLAAHGRFIHLATKVLIRELLSSSSQRRMRRSCPCRQRPSLRRSPGTAGIASPTAQGGGKHPECRPRETPISAPPWGLSPPAPASPLLPSSLGGAELDEPLSQR